MRRVLRRAAGVLAIVGVLYALALGAGRLPSGTSGGSLVVRGLVGLAIGLVLVIFVRRMLRALSEPPPPSPKMVDVPGSDIVYECTLCGTRVRLEVAATGKAPKHCGEEMVPKLG